MNTEAGHCCFSVALSENFVWFWLRAAACWRKCVCETQEEGVAIQHREERKVGGFGGCAIEQPPVMRGSMLTRMVSNTAWGNSSFTPRLKPSSLFCLPSSVNISLSPGTDSGVNRNQIMHTNISVTQDFQRSFCLCLPQSFLHTQTVLLCLSIY